MRRIASSLTRRLPSAISRELNKSVFGQHTRSNGNLISRQKFAPFALHISRKYSFSYDNDSSLKDKILSASLKYVDQHGWSEDAIVQGAKELGLSPLSIGICDNGAADLVLYFLNQKRAAVRESFHQSMNTGDVSKKDTLYTAISLHLDLMQPYVEQWPNAIAHLVDHRLLLENLNAFMGVIEDLCDFKGIRSSRMDWYTERALLGILYTTTELFMLSDRSPNLQDTRDFLDRNLQNYYNIHSLLLEKSDQSNRIRSILQSFSPLFFNLANFRGSGSEESPLAMIFKIFAGDYNADSQSYGHSQSREEPKTRPSYSSEDIPPSKENNDVNEKKTD